jgi:hypothetical protein
VGIRCADHVTPSTHKSRHYFADSGGRLVGIVRLRTKAKEFSLCIRNYYDVEKTNLDKLIQDLDVLRSPPKYEKCGVLSVCIYCHVCL